MPSTDGAFLLKPSSTDNECRAALDAALADPGLHLDAGARLCRRRCPEVSRSRKVRSVDGHEYGSVLIAVYARDDASCRRVAWSNVLEQTELPDELGVAVDGPIGRRLEDVLPDARAAFSARLGPGFMTVVRLCREKSRISNALNEGIARCRCDFVAAPRSTPNNISYPGTLCMQKKVLAESPEVDVDDGRGSTTTTSTGA